MCRKYTPKEYTPAMNPNEVCGLYLQATPGVRGSAGNLGHTTNGYTHTYSYS